MIEDCPIDLPRTTAWHSILITTRNGLETRYWLRVYDLSYYVCEGDLLIYGMTQFLKTRSRVTQLPRQTPARLRRIWELGMEYERKIVAAEPDNLVEDFVNGGLGYDILINARTASRLVELAMNEIGELHSRLAPIILNKPRLELIQET